MTFENTGPGAATDVVGVDVLPDGPTWTIGSGSNICTLDGTTVACSAEQVADGVFEVFEFIGTIGPDDCGTFDNTAEVTFAGGPRPGSVSAVGPTVTVTGCPTATATPAPTPRPTPTPCAPAAPSPTSSPGEGGEPGEEGPTDPCSGGLPDTRLPPSATWLPAILVIAALVLTAVLRFRPRSAAAQA